MSARIRLTIIAAAITLALAACGDDDNAAPEHSAAASGSRAQPPSGVALTGVVHEVTMHTDERGNYFSPAELEVRPGDVVRFKLVTGVHNVNFVADSNKFASWLPPLSAFLQLPGQTLDVPMTFGEGKFYYQCDPHALLGMVGRIEVEKED